MSKRVQNRTCNILLLRLFAFVCICASLIALFIRSISHGLSSLVLLASGIFRHFHGRSPRTTLLYQRARHLPPRCGFQLLCQKGRSIQLAMCSCHMTNEDQAKTIIGNAENSYKQWALSLITKLESVEGAVEKKYRPVLGDPYFGQSR